MEMEPEHSIMTMEREPEHGIMTMGDGTRTHGVYDHGEHGIVTIEMEPEHSIVTMEMKPEHELWWPKGICCHALQPCRDADRESSGDQFVFFCE